jgi:hypothetical protein
VLYFDVFYVYTSFLDFEKNDKVEFELVESRGYTGS